MNWWPMHSWHPVVVHLPLVGLVVAVAFDLVAARNRSARWREAATVLWWVGLLGAAAAVTTGLLAYGRVEHSDPAHVEMVLHRNLALAAVTVLLVTAVWRWRRSYSRRAALSGLSAPGSWLAWVTWEEIWFIATPWAFPPRPWKTSPRSGVGM